MSKAKKLWIWERSLPEKTMTLGPPPGPAAQMTSGKPSPLTSPTATRTPPANFESKAKKPARKEPSALKTLTSGPPPASAAVTNTLAGSGKPLDGAGPGVVVDTSVDLGLSPAPLTAVTM